MLEDLLLCKLRDLLLLFFFVMGIVYYEREVLHIIQITFIL